MWEAGGLREDILGSSPGEKSHYAMLTPSQCPCEQGYRGEARGADSWHHSDAAVWKQGPELCREEGGGGVEPGTGQEIAK